jgi:hypothetical protein
MSRVVHVAVAGLATAGLVIGHSGAVAPAGAVDSLVTGTIGRPCSGNIHMVAVGSPGRDLGGVRDAGAVMLRHPFSVDDRGTVLTSADLGVAPGSNDRFGASIAWANLSVGDRIVESYGPSLTMCPDLLIGVPGAQGGRGAVVVVPDFGAGLEPTRALWLTTGTIGMQPGDGLGSAMGVAGPAYADPTPTVAVVAGAPGRDAPGAPDAGALIVWTFPVVAGDLAVPPALPASTTDAALVQGSGGMKGHAEPKDRFGSVISSGNPLTVGIPSEDIGRKKDAGAVASLTFTAGRMTSNELLWMGAGLPGRARAGDRAGASVYQGTAFVVGVPGRDSNGRKDSGAVLARWNWTVGPQWSDPPTWKIITQNTRGMPDTSERGDGFGSSVTYLVGRRGSETSAIAVGVPGEGYGRRRNVGAVTYIDLFFEREDSEGRWAFARQPLPRRTSGDRFGSSFVRVPGDPADDDAMTDTLIVGAPGLDLRGVPNAGRCWQVGFATTAFATGTTPQERMGK